VLGGDPIEFGEQLALEFQLLRDGFDDEVSFREGRALDAEVDAAHQRITVGLAELAAVDRSLRRPGDRGAPTLQRRVIPFDGYDREAMPGEDLRYAGPHRAQSDNPHDGDGPVAHPRSLGSRVRR